MKLFSIKLFEHLENSNSSDFELLQKKEEELQEIIDNLNDENVKKNDELVIKLNRLEEINKRLDQLRLQMDIIEEEVVQEEEGEEGIESFVSNIPGANERNEYIRLSQEKEDLDEEIEELRYSINTNNQIIINTDKILNETKNKLKEDTVPEGGPEPETGSGMNVIFLILICFAILYMVSNMKKK
jgi:chromosome segregation ATPase